MKHIKFVLIFIATFLTLVVAFSVVTHSQQVTALVSKMAEISGISISTGDFVAKTLTSDTVVAATSSADLAPTPQKTIDQFVTKMTASDAAAIYDLMSSEFKDTFTAADFEKSWSESGEKIVSVENLPTIQMLQKDWYTQQVVAKTQSGKADKFNLVLHLENGKWVIYATEPLT
ncbi:MAG: hypothetical protein NT141_01245 [candidate division WWE3 bacterium]|nr:hypothetical protein [candidate division WWE3 bacterium]